MLGMYPSPRELEEINQQARLQMASMQTSLCETLKSALKEIDRPIPKNITDIAYYILGSEYITHNLDSKTHKPNRAALLNSLFADPVDPNTPESEAVEAAIAHYPKVRAERRTKMQLQQSPQNG